MPLIGFRYPDGRLVCVDCDIYPPGTEDVRAAEPEDVCAICKQRLADVEPVT